MEPRRQEFRVGKLVVQGDRFAFEPEASLKFEGRTGDIASVYLHYGYEEASRLKETLDLKFSVEFNGKRLGTRSTRIEDSRVVKDEQWGLLKYETNLDTKGTLKGAFTIEATYEKGLWSGKGENARTPFKHVGGFIITVR